MTRYPSIMTITGLVTHFNMVRAYHEGKWVPTRPAGYPSIWQRFKAAWMVFTGRADAVIWEGYP